MGFAPLTIDEAVTLLSFRPVPALSRAGAAFPPRFQARFGHVPARLRDARRIRGLPCRLAFPFASGQKLGALHLRLAPGFLGESRSLALGHDGKRTGRQTCLMAEGAAMIHARKRILSVIFAVFFVAAVRAGEPPKLTPEQQAEMEAYQKAGTPGAPHAALASTTGNYDLDLKNWSEPGGAPMESTGKATGKMILDGRVLVEAVEATMMGYDNVSGEYWSTWMDSMKEMKMMEIVYTKKQVRAASCRQARRAAPRSSAALSAASASSASKAISKACPSESTSRRAPVCSARSSPAVVACQAMPRSIARAAGSIAARSAGSDVRACAAATRARRAAAPAVKSARSSASSDSTFVVPSQIGSTCASRSSTGSIVSSR